MLVGNNVSYSAVTEAYCLLSSYIREEGTLGAKYDKEYLNQFVMFLANVLKHPENFVEDDKTERERHSDGSFKHNLVSDHDGTGLA